MSEHNSLHLVFDWHHFPFGDFEFIDWDVVAEQPVHLFLLAWGYQHDAGTFGTEAGCSASAVHLSLDRLCQVLMNDPVHPVEVYPATRHVSSDEQCALRVRTFETECYFLSCKVWLLRRQFEDLHAQSDPPQSFLKETHAFNGCHEYDYFVFQVWTDEWIQLIKLFTLINNCLLLFQECRHFHGNTGGWLIQFEHFRLFQYQFLQA